MSEPWIRKTINEHECELVVSGELDAANSGEFAALACDTLREAAVASMVIDLATVDFLDSSGLGSLVLALNVADQLGKKLALTHVPDRLQKLLKTTGLDDLFIQRETSSSGLEARAQD